MNMDTETDWAIISAYYTAQIIFQADLARVAQETADFFKIPDASFDQVTKKLRETKLEAAKRTMKSLAPLITNVKNTT